MQPKSKPVGSFVVTSYNHGCYIGECIDSILQQVAGLE